MFARQNSVSRLSLSFLRYHDLLVAFPKSVFHQRALNHAVSYHFPSCAIVPGRESLAKSEFEFASHFLRVRTECALFSRICCTCHQQTSLCARCCCSRSFTWKEQAGLIWPKSFYVHETWISPQNLVDIIFTARNRVLQSTSKSRFTIRVSGFSKWYPWIHKSLYIKYFITQFKATGNWITVISNRSAFKFNDHGKIAWREKYVCLLIVFNILLYEFAQNFILYCYINIP